MDQVTINKRKLDKAMEEMCDSYCKWVFNTETQAELNEICDRCPLSNLIEDKYPFGYCPQQE